MQVIAFFQAPTAFLFFQYTWTILHCRFLQQVWGHIPQPRGVSLSCAPGQLSSWSQACKQWPGKVEARPVLRYERVVPHLPVSVLWSVRVERTEDRTISPSSPCVHRSLSSCQKNSAIVTRFAFPLSSKMLELVMSVLRATVGRSLSSKCLIILWGVHQLRQFQSNCKCSPIPWWLWEIALPKNHSCYPITMFEVYILHVLVNTVSTACRTCIRHIRLGASRKHATVSHINCTLMYEVPEKGRACVCTTVPANTVAQNRPHDEARSRQSRYCDQ